MSIFLATARLRMSGTVAAFSRAVSIPRCAPFLARRPTFGPGTGVRLTTRRPFFKVFMSAVEDDETAWNEKTVDSTWNVTGLKKEVQRLILRCHKKIGKSSQRVSQAQMQLDQLMADKNASLSDLEKCPDVDALTVELDEFRARLHKLNVLEQALAAEKKGTHRTLSAEVVELVRELGVNDEPPVPQPRPLKKQKGPRVTESSRKPYRRYFSAQQVEIRVGKQAEDNDELTMSPEHRDGADWWMHASGCPGSHIVIRCHDQNLDEQVVQDAAALAARQSKCNGSVIKVSLTRCRDIVKPPGAKAGLVQLVGNVRTVSVNMKEAQARLQRLDATCIVN